MSFLQFWMLSFAPLIALPVIIHLINQWRYQTKRWGAMMFLLKANQMARGYAKLRQYLILAMRTLAIAGLLFAVARPMASGLLGWGGGGTADTTILLLDRSPSMQQSGSSGQSKLETGRRQISDALQTLGSTRWVLIDSGDPKPKSFDSLQGLVDSPGTEGASSSADLPAMMQSALEYLKNNTPGAAEVWICSDLRAGDWNADSGNWTAIREAFNQLPQSVRFHLLAYPEESSSNVSVRVTDVRRQEGPDGNGIFLSMRFSRDGDAETPMTLPVQIEIDGALTEEEVEINGSTVDLKDFRVKLSGDQQRGWGRVVIPADENLSDNEFYFVFDDPPQRRIVLVSENRDETMALEIAAGISPDGKSDSTVEVMTPEELDSLVLDDAALLVWQTDLPDEETAGAIKEYVDSGGQVLFFPPSRLLGGISAGQQQKFLGVGWDSWATSDKKVMVENWRGDQDLLAATQSGGGLPVGQIEIKGYAKLTGDVTHLATVTGGDPLVARVTTEKGGVYFCTASTGGDRSTLGKNGIVLYVCVQRAIQQGLSSLGQTALRTAGAMEGPTNEWRKIYGGQDVLSSEYSLHAGVYRDGIDEDAQWLAINRSNREDQRDTIEDAQVDNLFAGLEFARVDDSAGNLSGIVREIWRLFLVAMIIAMLAEAILCIPRRSARKATSATDFGFGKKAENQETQKAEVAA